MKYCSKCGLQKNLEAFYKRKKGKRSGEHYEKCKECMKARGRDYYHKNRERQLFLALIRKKKGYLEKRRLILGYKNKPCADCGGVFPYYVMDFDHRDKTQKIDNVASMSGRGWTNEKIMKEIAKCDIVCANCHRIRTYGKGNAEVAKVVTAGL